MYCTHITSSDVLTLHQDTGGGPCGGATGVVVVAGAGGTAEEPAVRFSESTPSEEPSPPWVPEGGPPWVPEGTPFSVSTPSEEPSPPWVPERVRYTG